jgi:predicted phosphodiesterase
MHLYIVLSDFQYPFVDQAVEQLVLQFVDDMRPQGIILAGDVVDCTPLSKYPKDPQAKATLATEVHMAEQLMKRLQAIPVKVWLQGNHCDRVQHYVACNAPALGVLPELIFQHLFHTAEHDFEVLPYKELYRLGHMQVTHGHIVRPQAGATVLAHMARYGGSFLVGHSHRFAMVYRTDLQGVHTGIENGCLCQRAMPYDPYPNAQQGFSQ